MTESSESDSVVETDMWLYIKNLKTDRKQVIAAASVWEIDEVEKKLWKRIPFAPKSANDFEIRKKLQKQNKNRTDYGIVEGSCMYRIYVLKAADDREQCEALKSKCRNAGPPRLSLNDATISLQYFLDYEEKMAGLKLQAGENEKTKPSASKVIISKESGKILERLAKQEGAMNGGNSKLQPAEAANSKPSASKVIISKESGKILERLAKQEGAMNGGNSKLQPAEAANSKLPASKVVSQVSGHKLASVKVVSQESGHKLASVAEQGGAENVSAVEIVGNKSDQEEDKLPDRDAININKINPSQSPSLNFHLMKGESKSVSCQTDINGNSLDEEISQLRDENMKLKEQLKDNSPDLLKQIASDTKMISEKIKSGLTSKMRDDTGSSIRNLKYAVELEEQFKDMKVSDQMTYVGNGKTVPRAILIEIDHDFMGVTKRGERVFHVVANAHYQTNLTVQEDIQGDKEKDQNEQEDNKSSRNSEQMKDEYTIDRFCATKGGLRFIKDASAIIIIPAVIKKAVDAILQSMYWEEPVPTKVKFQKFWTTHPGEVRDRLKQKKIKLEKMTEEGAGTGEDKPATATKRGMKRKIVTVGDGESSEQKKGEAMKKNKKKSYKSVEVVPSDNDTADDAIIATTPKKLSDVLGGYVSTED